MHSRSLFGLFALLIAAQPVLAQGQWPSRPVRIIATSPPGGSVDFLARTLAENFSRAFGQVFVVDNRPGANGNIGVDAALKSPADGHALFVAPPGPFAINAHLMGAMPFSAGDIAPVAMLAVAPLLLVTHSSVPSKNLKELIAWLEAGNGAANYASQAVGSTGHLAMELFKARAGVEATHVPYRGSAAAATADLLAGRVALSFVNTSTTLAYIQQGQLRAIAVAEKKRIAAAPDVPTLNESGLPGFEATPWLGLGARAGTPVNIIEPIAEESRRALALPEVAARMTRIGIEPRPMTPEQFAAFIRADTEKWAEIIRRSGARAE